MFSLSDNLESKSMRLLAEDEGFRNRLYKCSKGFNTIGYGFNLDTGELPNAIAQLWLRYLLEDIYQKLFIQVTAFRKLEDARKYVLINMAYQMGIHGLLGFKKFIAFLEQQNYTQAANELKDSQWHRDFPDRSNRLIDIMIKGDF